MSAKNSVKNPQKAKKKTKVPFSTIAKTLYSNQAVIDSRKRPWYISIVIAVLAVFLVWIPALVSGYKTNAAGGLAASNNYEVNKAIKHIIGEEEYFKAIKVDNDKDGRMVLNRDGLSAYGASDSTWQSEYDLLNTKPLFASAYNDSSSQGASAYIKEYTNLNLVYYFDCVGVKNTGTRIKPSVSGNSASTTPEYETEQTTFLEAYYFPALSRKNEKAVQYLNNFITTVILNRNAEGKLGNYPHSFRLVGQDFLNVGFFTLQTTKSSAQRAASYQGDLSSGLEAIGAKQGDSLYSVLFKDASSIDEAYDNGFVSLAHASAWENNIKSTWINIGILSGIVVGLILLSGLIMFLLSRRKISKYRDTSFLDARKEGCSMTLTPSLIARIAGFRSSQYLYRVLIAGSLRRLVFANNKVCPPLNTQSDNKPLYQARD